MLHTILVLHLLEMTSLLLTSFVLVRALDDEEV